MAAFISKKVRITILVLVGILASGAAYAYQKIFGGKARPLPTNSFIISPKITPEETSVPVAAEAVAVAYAQTPEAGIDEVVRRTGDLDFIKPGQKVLIKPNVNSDDPAPGTTNPASLAEMVRLVKAKGAYVIVGDRSNPAWNTIAAMKKTGIYDAAKNAGADEIIGFENAEYIRVKPEKANYWPNGFRIPKLLAEVDHIISVPVLHTHSIAGHSLAIKNLVGLILPADRMLFHSSRKIDEMIAEISLAVKPSLTVIDGTRAFITGGPSHGTVAETKVYLASGDTLMADVIGVGLLAKHGASLPGGYPWQSRQIRHFLNLGLSGYTQSEIQEEATKI
jgi:uncharacterized protein (DUF362 family)